MPKFTYLKDQSGNIIKFGPYNTMDEALKASQDYYQKNLKGTGSSWSDSSETDDKYPSSKSISSGTVSDSGTTSTTPTQTTTTNRTPGITSTNPNDYLIDEFGNITLKSTGQHVTENDAKELGLFNNISAIPKATVNYTGEGATGLQPGQPIKPEGIDQTDWNSVPVGMQTVLSAVNDFIKAQMEAGKKVPVVLTPDVLSSLWTEAQNDPVIQKYYGDLLRVGDSDFKNTISNLQQDYATLTSQYQRQFTQEDKDLADAEAAAGRVYSGFRKQAEDKLNAQQSDIIESTNKTAQRAAREAASAYEKRFGTSALQNAGIPTIAGSTYTPYGNIAGTLAQEKLADIEKKYQSLQKDKLLKMGATQ